MNNNWEEVELRAVCCKTRQWKPATEPRDMLSYIDVSAVSNSSYSIVAPQEVAGNSAPGRARKIVQARDVLFATIRPTLRRIALVPSELDDQIASTAFCVIRANKEIALPEFLYFSVLTISFNNSISESQHGASYPAVRDKDVLAQKILLPLLPEQKKIAALLLKIQRAIETQDKIIQALRDLKKSIMRRLFTRGLRGEKTKITEIGEIPESWEVVPIENFCTLLSGGTPKKSVPTFWKGTIPWASPKDMKRSRLEDTEDHISIEGLKSGSTLAPKGSVLVVVRGMILARDVPVAMIGTPMAFNQDIKAIIADEKLIPDFLLYALEAHKNRLFTKIGRSAHGTRTILSSTISDFLLPMPTIDEQKGLSQTLSLLDRLLEKKVVGKTKLDELMTTLLNQLISGEISTKDLFVATNGLDLSPHEGHAE